MTGLGKVFGVTNDQAQNVPGILIVQIAQNDGNVVIQRLTDNGRYVVLSDAHTQILVRASTMNRTGEKPTPYFDGVLRFWHVSNNKLSAPLRLSWPVVIGTQGWRRWQLQRTTCIRDRNRPDTQRIASSRHKYDPPMPLSLYRRRISPRGAFVSGSFLSR